MRIILPYNAKVSTYTKDGETIIEIDDSYGKLLPALIDSIHENLYDGSFTKEKLKEIIDND